MAGAVMVTVLESRPSAFQSMCSGTLTVSGAQLAIASRAFPFPA